jgi:sugar transferase (PEP-CTERM/EpsH1 system associated)
MTRSATQPDPVAAEAVGKSEASTDASVDGAASQASAAPRRRRVLMLTHRLPYPPDRGDRIRAWFLVKTLSQHFDLSLACTSDEPVWLQHHQLLTKYAKNVTIQPVTSKGMKVRGIWSLATGGAVTPASFYRIGLYESMLQWHMQQPFDAVLTFCTGMIHYTRQLTRYCRAHGLQKPAHVLDLVDVDSIKWRSYAKSTMPPMKWVYAAEARRLARIEGGKYDAIDAVTVISDAEAKAYRQQVPSELPLHVVGNGVNVEYFVPQPDCPKPTMCFVGVLNYKPNADGIEWFVRNVMPLLRQRVPEATLKIVGRHPTPAVKELGKEPGVEVVGSVPDVRIHMRDSGVVIAPLQLARGVQNKVLEAMSSERAVVCSPAAAQGIEATPGEHLVVADEPRQWVDALERLFSDAAHRQRLAAAARQHIVDHYSWGEQLQPMVDLLNRVMQSAK